MSSRPFLISCVAICTLASQARGQEEEEMGRYELYRRAPGYAWDFDHSTSRGPFGTRALGLRPGQLRLQARYFLNEGSGLRNRSSSISNERAFAERGYEYVPTDQRNEMTLFELAYGVTEDLTLSVEVPLHDKTWDNVTSTGQEFRQTSDGVGDIQLWAHNKWFAWGQEQAFWSAGLSLPTGSFDETGFRPSSAAPVVLPFQMQLGSGTYDLSGMMSWSGYDGKWSWGGNILQTWRLFGPNDRRYTLGSYREAVLWGGRNLTESIVATLRVKYHRQGDIHGQDPALSRARSPSEHPDQQKVKRADILAGISFYQGEGYLKGLRVGLEAGLPLWQQLRGPQIEKDYFAGIGLQWSF